MRRVLMLVAGLMMATSAAGAQTLATPESRWGWDQSGDRTGLAYELSVDDQPYAPLLDVQCDAGGTCSAALTVAMGIGEHTARMRAWREVAGVRRTSAPSGDLAFVYVGPDPSAPGNFRLLTPGVVALGVVRDRYPFAGLDVARVVLDAGPDLYFGALSLSIPGYAVRPGDRVGLVLRRGQ